MRWPASTRRLIRARRARTGSSGGGAGVATPACWHGAPAGVTRRRAPARLLPARGGDAEWADDLDSVEPLPVLQVFGEQGACP